MNQLRWPIFYFHARALLWVLVKFLLFLILNLGTLGMKTYLPDLFVLGYMHASKIILHCTFYSIYFIFKLEHTGPTGNFLGVEAKVQGGVSKVSVGPMLDHVGPHHDRKRSLSVSD